MKYIPVLFLLANTLFAAAQDKDSIIIFSDTSRVVVLQADSLHPIFLSDRDMVVAEKVFTKALEIQFPPVSKKQKKSKSGIDIKRYYIQLVPKHNAKGELEIWFNCFCLDWNLDWRNKLFSRHTVEDGGSCFFELLININEEHYTGFDMNGVG